MAKSPKAWHGNQYYDSKKKKWLDGKKPKYIKLGHNNWFWGILGFVILSIAVTVILNHFYPNSSFSFFIW
jgi:hypothetical protein